MFVDRREAGFKLASILIAQKNLKDFVVVSIPRGGVIVGDVVANILQAPHMSLIVKKISAPHNPELAVGAMGSDKNVFWDEEMVKNLKISSEDKNHLIYETYKEIIRREKELTITPFDPLGKTAILIDDGVATGATAIAASRILKGRGAGKIILATPVISQSTKQAITKYFDKIITAELPRYFRAVGEFYENFPQVEDDEVRKVLKR